MELDPDGLSAAHRASSRRLQADAVVLALGQETESGFLREVPGIVFKRDGTVIVGPDMMTGAPGIFAGGDMVPSERTVTVAVGHGKKAARHIDAWLRGSRYQHPPSTAVVAFDDAAPAGLQRRRPDAAARTVAPPSAPTGFAEVMAGLTEPEARYEAQRCLSCGNCFECDNCYAACPEDAIIKLGPGRRYRYDYAKCTGCAVCFEQCPCHAIEMIAEPASA